MYTVQVNKGTVAYSVQVNKGTILAYTVQVNKGTAGVYCTGKRYMLAYTVQVLVPLNDRNSFCAILLDSFFIYDTFILCNV